MADLRHATAPEAWLELAQVACILFTAGTGREPGLLYHDARHVHGGRHPGLRCLSPNNRRRGARSAEADTGWNKLVHHPDGMRVEYVEHRDKHPADRMPDTQ